MIEAEQAERLGATIHSPSNDADIARILSQTGGLGLRHLRLRVDPSSEPAMLDDLLAGLSGSVEVLPSFERMDAGGIRRFLDRNARYVHAIEVTARGHDASVLAAIARRVADAGIQFVVGVDGDDASPLAGLAEAGVLRSAHAIGVRLSRAAACLPSPRDMLIAARSYAPNIRLWVTEAGADAAHQPATQAAIFLDALGTEADRVYWHALSDRLGCPQHSGFYDAAGEKSLLARLLTGGVAGVERVMAATRRAHPAHVRPVLVTGGAGFIGSNLVHHLASDGHHVHVFDALARPGVERNLRWLTRQHPSRVSFELGDLRDETALERAAADASCVFHLAGQVAVTTSMVRPLDDFDVNARGTLTLLDALRRRNPDAPLIFASTNKVYGDLADIELVRDGDRYVPARADLRARGVSESRKLCFHTPYGCSKGTADQYVLDYAHSFGLRTAVLRMSCIYGERQFGTEDQGWVAHFLLRAIAGEPITIYGDGAQVRDVLHVGDAVAAYLAAWREIDTISGRAYNLGGGPANAISLLQLIEQMESMLGTRIDATFSAWRPGDQRYFVADTDAIRRDLNLPMALGWRAGLRRLAQHFGATLPSEAPVEEHAL